MPIDEKFEGLKIDLPKAQRMYHSLHAEAVTDTVTLLLEHTDQFCELKGNLYREEINNAAYCTLFFGTRCKYYSEQGICNYQPPKQNEE